MKNQLFRFILKVHKKLPFVPFEKELIKIYHFFQDKNEIVNTKIDGINYKLDLSELIDNKVFYQNWEPEMTKMFKKTIKSGMTVLDVGANMGYYTLLMGKLMKNKGKIISFEPTLGGFERLKTNVSLNDFNNIVLERIGLANKNGKIKAKIRHSWKMSSLIEPKAETIYLMRLDDYVKKNKIEKIDFIKIDVDGYEYEVLKGAKEILEKYKPILCLEIGNYENKKGGYKLKDIIDYLESFKYSFYYENGKPVNSIKELINKILNLGADNFLLK